jgi:hypothetical protein
VSHQPERKEKDCLNCGAEVLGTYCQNCGQKNIVVRQTFWQLLTHFVYDILHFDGKFFDTLKPLLFKPGQVPKEYMSGRRASYLDPIRMYLFTSALFFLIFSWVSKGGVNRGLGTGDEPLAAQQRVEILDEIKKELAEDPADTTLLMQLNRLQDTTKPVRASDLLQNRNAGISTNFDTSIRTVQQYDSVQQTLPKEQRDGWLKQKIMLRGLTLFEKYGTRPKEGLRHFIDVILHNLPYLLFISLPFFALILKLLYLRRKSYYYSDHAVFTLYQYIFSFIFLLILFSFGGLANWTHLKLFENLMPLLAVVWTVYLFIAMKRFYGQGVMKTFSKFLLLNLLGIIVLLLLFVIFLFFTFFQL